MPSKKGSRPQMLTREVKKALAYSKKRNEIIKRIEKQTRAKLKRERHLWVLQRKKRTEAREKQITKLNEEIAENFKVIRAL